MGSVISFENHALANLRARVAAAEEANQDLIAFARGHSGAVASIHEAVLAAVETDGLDHLLHVVTQEWPQILGLDAVAVALHAGDTGVRADASGLQFVDAKLIARAIKGFDGVAAARLRAGPSPVRAGLRADPGRGPDPPDQRTAAAERPARPRPAQCRRASKRATARSCSSSWAGC